MKAIDIRNETWASVQERLERDRKAVWLGYQKHGPCTTRALAEKMPMSIFTVRPRTTELLDMFLLELVGKNKDGGIYGYVPESIARGRFENLKNQLCGLREVVKRQPQLETFTALELFTV